jgi:hypothetical protein
MKRMEDVNDGTPFALKKAMSCAVEIHFERDSGL